MMLNNLIEQLKNLLNGDVEFVDEQQTEILQASFVLMRIFRILPQAGNRVIMKDLLVCSAIMFPITASFSVCHIIVTYINRTSYVLDDILQDFAVIGCAINMFCNMAVIMIKSPLIARLEQEVGNFRTYRKPLKFDAANRWANFVTIFLCSYTFFGILCFTFMNYLQRNACFKENEELGIERICGTIAPSPLPMYFNEGFYFYLLAIVQAMNCLVVCEAAAIILTFLYGIIQLLVARIRLLKDELRVSFQIIDPKKRKAHLKYCVRYHVYLINLTRQLNEAISALSLIQSTFTSVIIAMVAFEMLMKPELKTALHGMGWVFVMWMLCSAGQKLIDETSDIPFHIYSTDWFEGDVDTMKYVLMIIWRGNHNLFIDSLGFGQLSLTTFAAAMQNAYSVVALLYDSQDND